METDAVRERMCGPRFAMELELRSRDQFSIPKVEMLVRFGNDGEDTPENAAV
jgi:hypothetical protein